MQKKLFLLDGMALVYRAHFALIRRPIFTSKGVNTSALYGFTQTLIDILTNQSPTHLAVAFDTEAPTRRQQDFAAYKEQREAMPEDITLALPNVMRLLAAFRIPVLTCDGYEADDIIGTLVGPAEKQGFISYMVTPDKDFGQLVSAQTYLYKPSRMGDAVEVLGVPEILAKWGVERPAQVIDVLALWGDISDNIPGVPGIGEKTASKLIAQYGSVENLLAHTAELKEKVRETLEQHRQQALQSKSLATICRDVPIPLDLEAMRLQARDDEALQSILIEFEFNSIGRRLFGPDFKAGRGGLAGADARAHQAELAGLEEEERAAAPGVRPALRKLEQVPHQYRLVRSAREQRDLIERLAVQRQYAFCTVISGLDPKADRVLGIAFAVGKGEAYFFPLADDVAQAQGELERLKPIFQSDRVLKIGHGLKADLSVLSWQGIKAAEPFFDVALAHSLVEPDMRHSLEYVSESCLGYSPLSLAEPGGKIEEIKMGEYALERVADCAMEKADLALQLKEILEPVLKEKGQERVFFEIESPLLPVLVEMECEGVRVDAAALADFAIHLSKEMDGYEKSVFKMAGTEFNLNSPKQLGEILFEILRLAEKPKKTKTGQYATNEQTLLALAAEHEIVRRILDFRAATKLKSTYVDALPTAICQKTGRIHTTYHQTATATGRLASVSPNLQNIPIRTELGREIRKAFVPRNEEFALLSADYSQIELRIIASLSGDRAMIEAFESGHDIHAATASRVFGVPLEQVTAEMRRKAKMVNFGIAYGISAFGLAQRLAISRQEAAEIIQQYFARFPGIQKYIHDTIAFAQSHGYVQTMTGRRRYLRDIRSSNATVRAAAERNAINAPIQGTAADMIKIAMVEIHRELAKQQLKTRMLLQVHDELVFDLHRAEEETVVPLVRARMAGALKLAVPVVVEVGTGRNWLEAH